MIFYMLQSKNFNFMFTLIFRRFVPGTWYEQCENWNVWANPSAKVKQL